MINRYNIIKKEIEAIDELIFYCESSIEEAESDFVKSEIEQDIKRLIKGKAKLLARLKKISSF